MEFDCWQILHGGEGQRGEHVTILHASDGYDAAEQAADYFDDVEQLKERCGDDQFDGATQYIEVVDKDGKPSRHEVVCEVKRVYMSVVR